MNHVERERVEELRRWWASKMTELGMTQDFSLTVEGVCYLLDTIFDRKSIRILELGSGFSTLAIRSFVPDAWPVPGWRHGKWRGKIEKVWMFTAEHDPKWLQIVDKILSECELDHGGMYSIDEFRRETERVTDGFWANGPNFDLVLVDHGPEMKTRVDDLPWIVSLMAQDGAILLDDFRRTTGYQKEVTDALDGLGWSVSVEDASRSANRAIGIAVRK